MRTLILNAGYEPMQMVSWQRALCLVLAQKAEVVAEYGELVRSVSTSFALPSVVRLTRYVRVVQTLGFVRCTRKNVLMRDNFQCQYCGVRCRATSITIDHVVPRARGGRTTWNNVVAACHTCNRSKGSLPLERCGMKLMRKPRRPAWRDILSDSQKESMADWLPYMDYAG